MPKQDAWTLLFDGDDQPLPPNAPPETIDEFAVQLGFADVGWMDVEILAGRQAFDFRTSYVFDPYPEILQWLETIAEGGIGRVEVDGEGCATHLMVAASQADAIRFTVVDEHSGPGRPLTQKMSRSMDGHKYTFELLCDVELPRREFVAKFYNGLRAGWESPSAVGFWERWYNTTTEQWAENYDEPFADAQYAMQSDIIDDYLRR